MAAHRTKYPYKPSGVAGQLQRLCEINFGKHGVLPVVKKGTPEWDMWRSWRQRHGIGVGFMDARLSWTVPTEMPPKTMADLEAQIGGGEAW